MHIEIARSPARRGAAGTGGLSRRQFVLAGAAAGLLPFAADAATTRYDVIVYGGTPAGIIAAIAAERGGMNVALVLGLSPFGGMVANGLSNTDASSLEFIKGIAAEFFTRCGAVYGLSYTLNFEPHVAETVFRQMLAETTVAIIDDVLDLVGVEGKKITAIRLGTGTTLSARAFVDASYEGDLMAGAGVSYATGRESQAETGEPLAGFGVGGAVHTISPYSNGRLLYGIKPMPNLAVGAADHAVMAYTFRLVLTADPANMIPFAEPPNYNPDDYLWWLRYNYNSTSKPFHPGDPILATGKFAFNSDADEGLNWSYPEGSAAARARIWARIASQLLGRLWFSATDPRVPATYRDSVRQYGLAADEFTDNGGLPRQLYVREARRLEGLYQLNQQDVQQGAVFTDAALTCHYHFDSHVTQFLAVDTRHTWVEGPLIGSTLSLATKAYQVPLRSFLPHPFECTNLAVPVCISATRVANCSYRMEPAYMQAGDACGTLAAKAIATGTPMWRLV